jgi:hypothetical protein
MFAWLSCNAFGLRCNCGLFTAGLVVCGERHSQKAVAEKKRGEMYSTGPSNRAANSKTALRLGMGPIGMCIGYCKKLKKLKVDVLLGTAPVCN